MSFFSLNLAIIIAIAFAPDNARFFAGPEYRSVIAVAMFDVVLVATTMAFISVCVVSHASLLEVNQYVKRVKRNDQKRTCQLKNVLYLRLLEFQA